MGSRTRPEWNAAYYQAHREELSAYKREWAHRNRNRLRGNWRLRQYGLSPAEFTELLVRQDGCCAICGLLFDLVTIKRGDLAMPYIDHDHKADGVVVRGLLCRDCNHGIGKFADDPVRLRTAAAYLEGGR